MPPLACLARLVFYTRPMPELAEVEYFRQRWDCGLGQEVLAVEIHAGKRIFRGSDDDDLTRTLTGAVLRSSQAHGKQMLFCFSRDGWLGLHLGMTGQLRREPTTFTPDRHDHLVLRQGNQALVFRDPRMFGRVQFHHGKSEPAWWSELPAALTSDDFTVALLGDFLRRHARAPLKAVLLDQARFPGLGNWMVDEILWRAQLHPRMPAGQVTAGGRTTLWRQIRFVCTGALRIVAKDYSDPPATWLFPHRWEKGGLCPKHRQQLDRATIGGRTTAWCPRCQPATEARKIGSDEKSVGAGGGRRHHAPCRST